MPFIFLWKMFFKDLSLLFTCNVRKKKEWDNRKGIKTEVQDLSGGFRYQFQERDAELIEFVSIFCFR